MRSMKQIAIFLGVVASFSSYIDEVVGDPSLIVEVQNGMVEGEQLNDMYAWRGIPYGKPPLGDLRFEPPQTSTNWSGTWNATYDRSSCIATTVLDVSIDSYSNPKGDEDCLYINVYTPQPPKGNQSLLPVMVWFYGGAFIAGNSTYLTFGPDGLVSKNNTFVSFNYRLGIFGFLSTNDNVVPGNNGLRDQILALEWVKKNIKAFGGDPNQVTIFGQSAGAVSISYLVLSPLASGLFRSVIMESGTALCVWSLSKKSRQAAFATAAKLNITAVTSQALVDGLRAVPAKQLQTASLLVMATVFAADPLNGFVYAPVIEAPSKIAVVTGDSYEKFKSGNFNQVPLIMGYNSAEGSFLIAIMKFIALYVASYDIIPARLVPSSMNANPINLNTIGTKIKNFYAGVNGTMAVSSDNFARYASDDDFVRPIQKTANISSKYTKTYFYRFSYSHDPTAVGVSHSGELPYIFNSSLNSTSDEYIKSCMITSWTDFAKTGDPSSSGACDGINWQPITSNSTLSYININRNITLSKNPDSSNITFWANIWDEYAIPPFITY